MVICSPLIAAVLADEKLSASKKSASIIVTIGHCTDLCDFALAANLPGEGWADAAHKLQQIQRPIHVTLLYSTQDKRSVAAAKLFHRPFSRPLEVIAIDKTSSREVRNTMVYIASRTVDVVIAPYLKDFYLFTQDGQAEGFSWVVDTYYSALGTQLLCGGKREKKFVLTCRTSSSNPIPLINAACW